MLMPKESRTLLMFSGEHQNFCARSKNILQTAIRRMQQPRWLSPRFVSGNTFMRGCTLICRVASRRALNILPAIDRHQSNIGVHWWLPNLNNIYPLHIITLRTADTWICVMTADIPRKFEYDIWGSWLDACFCWITVGKEFAVILMFRFQKWMWLLVPINFNLLTIMWIS